MKRLGGLTTITRKGNHSFSSSLHNWLESFLKELSYFTKGRSILFNHFIDMRTTVNLSISCRKTFFLHEMDKLAVVFMSIKWLNKIEQPLAGVVICSTVILKAEKMAIRNMVWINHLQYTLWWWIWSIFSSIQSIGHSWIGFEMFWQFKISCPYWYFHCNDLLWTLSIRKNSMGI